MITQTLANKFSDREWDLNISCKTCNEEENTQNINNGATNCMQIMILEVK